MVKSVLMVILIMLVDSGIGVAALYNQPKFSPCASWNSTAVTYNIKSSLGEAPESIFINTNNVLYIAIRENNTVYQYSSFPGMFRNISRNLSEPIGLFVNTNGDVYIDHGLSKKVEKWSPNAMSGEIAMDVDDSCYGLFIDINNTLYCSMGSKHKVVKKSLNNNETVPSIAAGNGSNGTESFMLNRPRGIFVDKKFNLYIADRGNHRIQRFTFGELNGTTVVGSGAAGTITLNEPTAVILDADNYLFITDSNNHRIVGSGPYGYRCLVGCNNFSGTQINSARSLSFNSYGSIVVTDKLTNQIHIFSLSTNYCNSTHSTTNIATTAMTTHIKSTFPTTMITTHQTDGVSLHSTPFKTVFTATTRKITTAVTGIRSITNPPPLPNFKPTPCNDSYRIGTTCNTSSTPCDLLKPCKTEGTCVNNKTAPNGYVCYCSSGFSGSECQLDIRPCKTNTCWNNGTCVSISSSDFSCICPDGWIGIHCETKVNYCQNITCQNNGVCRPLFRDYRCECSTSSYSGRHCEITASALVVRKIVSKSLGYIAIICILFVIGFIVVLDVLKYFFRIDPARHERERLRRRKAPKPKKKPVVAIRFKYISGSPAQASSDPTISIVEETTV